MSKIIVSAHQPNFMPYLGFFDKMRKSDIFVIRDEVLFVKKDYHQRNRIRINGNDNFNNPQFKWLKVPVESIEDYIMHILIKKDYEIKNVGWNIRMLNEIKASYKGSKFFDEFYAQLKFIFDNSDDKLLSLNMKIINFLKDVFNIDCEIVMASELGLKENNYSESDASEDLANICKELNADVYLSGFGGKEYLDLNPFKNKNIKLEFQDFNHPVYKQKFPGFIPNMAAIDALFCLGSFPEAEVQTIKMRS
ncbi:MAG: WbqC family protein [archaeon]